MKNIIVYNVEECPLTKMHIGLGEPATCYIRFITSDSSRDTNIIKTNISTPITQQEQ